MTKTPEPKRNLLMRLWLQLMRYLVARNNAAIVAWSLSLQYRRRYTNPDEAVRYRKRP